MQRHEAAPKPKESNGLATQVRTMNVEIKAAALRVFEKIQGDPRIRNSQKTGEQIGLTRRRLQRSGLSLPAELSVDIDWRSSENIEGAVGEANSDIRFLLELGQFLERTKFQGHLYHLADEGTDLSVSRVAAKMRELIGDSFIGFKSKILGIDRRPVVDDEELELWKGAEHQNPSALRGLLDIHKHYVWDRALKRMKIHHGKFDSETLFTEGMEGLNRGVMKFNYRMGYRPTTFLTHSIDHPIRRYMDENYYSSIRVPGIGDRPKAIRLLQRAREEEFKSEGELSLKDIIDTLPSEKNKPPITNAQRRQAWELSFTNCHSMDAPIGENGTLSVFYGDQDGDMENAGIESYKERMFERARMLITRGNAMEIHWKIFYGRIYEEKTLTEVGEELDLSRERIRQLEKEVLIRLSNDELFCELLRGSCRKEVFG